jgi:16S rRNA (guanine527-N7)-methyltransferase
MMSPGTQSDNDGNWDAFAGWSDNQLQLIDRYERLLTDANQRLNLVSRATATEIRDRHIVHSLTLALRDFAPGSSVVDWGTGGGLPGIPLAIRFPETTVHLVDSILKKTVALESFCKELGLDNVVVHRMRAEEWTTPVDYAVSRATAPLRTLWRWTEPFLKNELAAKANSWSGGLIVLKGGDLTSEIKALRSLRPGIVIEQLPLAGLTGGPGLEAKYVLSVRRGG